MTKIDIISGFLGAGKTTLIQKLLKEVLHQEKVVLIENEFGEIGIDGSFLKEAGIEIKEMNSGCICCSLVGDFEESLKLVIQEYHPERIIIEPSGVGKLSDVIKAVQTIDDITLNSYVAVVDGKKCKVYMKNFGEFFNNQIEHASALFVSHSQDMTDQQLVDVHEKLKELNPHCPIITTPWDQLEGSYILEVMNKAHEIDHDFFEEHDKECSCGHHHHEHDEECCCGHHHHEHDEECSCGHHHHKHDEECSCGHHHHEHDEECSCGHHHEHDEECCCGHHHHEHDEECSCGHHHHGHHHHHADEVFTSWSTETPKKYDEEEFKHILHTLAHSEDFGTILRAKGIVASHNEEWIYFDLLPGEYEIRHGKPDYTGRIVVIGAELKLEEIEKLFK